MFIISLRSHHALKKPSSSPHSYTPNNFVKARTPRPYVAHLLGVASIVLENGADEDEAIAALLHDAVEDQGGAEIREEVRERFGDHVAEIVDGCTDAEVVPKPPWRAGKEIYIQYLALASPSVRLVSMADKLYNARDPAGL